MKLCGSSIKCLISLNHVIHVILFLAKDGKALSHVIHLRDVGLIRLR